MLKKQLSKEHGGIMKASQLIEIFQYMLEKNEFHLGKMSNQFGVSERSLRYEIEKLNEQLFEKNEVKIEVEKGCLKHSNWEVVLQNIKSNSINSLSIQEREMYILLHIFLNREVNCHRPNRGRGFVGSI